MFGKHEDSQIIVAEVPGASKPKDTSIKIKYWLDFVAQLARASHSVKSAW